MGGWSSWLSSFVVTGIALWLIKPKVESYKNNLLSVDRDTTHYYISFFSSYKTNCRILAVADLMAAWYWLRSVSILIVFTVITELCRKHIFSDFSVQNKSGLIISLQSGQ